MKYTIHHQDSYAMLQVDLEKGESINSEKGAMIAMSEGVELTGHVEGGLVGGLIRKYITDEKFFTEKIIATRKAGFTCLGTGVGSIAVMEVNPNNPLFLKKGAYLASTEGVTVSAGAQGLIKGLTSGEGFFLIKVHGQGTVFLSCFGASHSFELAPGEHMIVDNGHLLAWESTLKYRMTKASKGIVSSLTSGEGLVCDFTGPGKLYIQTSRPLVLS